METSFWLKLTRQSTYRSSGKSPYIIISVFNYIVDTCSSPSSFSPSSPLLLLVLYHSVWVYIALVVVSSAEFVSSKGGLVCTLKTKCIGCSFSYNYIGKGFHTYGWYVCGTLLYITIWKITLKNLLCSNTHTDTKNPYRIGKPINLNTDLLLLRLFHRMKLLVMLVVLGLVSSSEAWAMKSHHVDSGEHDKHSDESEHSDKWVPRKHSKHAAMLLYCWANVENGGPISTQY